MKVLIKTFITWYRKTKLKMLERQLAKLKKELVNNKRCIKDGVNNISLALFQDNIHSRSWLREYTRSDFRTFKKALKVDAERYKLKKKLYRGAITNP